MNTNAIEIRNLSKRFDSFALENISFNVPTGSIVGFIGENGAGKTTTIKLILNQLFKNSGEIRLFGMDHTEQEMVIREKLGVVFSENNFYDSFSAFEVSRIISKTYAHWDQPRYLETLRTFNLPEKQKVKKYSRGMKMKLAIAIALAHDPKLLILDEATGGLDPIVRNEILDIFFNFIQDEDHSVLFSSHITTDLEKIADYIVFIHQGKIVLTEEKDLLLAKYGVAHCSNEALQDIDPALIIGMRRGRFGNDVLVKDREEVRRRHGNIALDPATIEDMMTYYVKGEQPCARC